jgi:hypothetical protein
MLGKSAFYYLMYAVEEVFVSQEILLCLIIIVQGVRRFEG